MSDIKTVSRIDALTPEQEARIPEWRDKWIKIGLCTEPADWKAFDEAIYECYRLTSLAPPKVIVRVSSPMVLALAAPMAAKLIEIITVREAVNGVVETAVETAICWPHEMFVMVSDRPERIKLDDRGRLHSEDGMSIRYRDGWGLWHVHGVAVDEQIVMRAQTQTVEQIKGERNEEVKRIRIERFGWDRYLTAIKAEVIDTRHNDIENTHEALVKCPDGMTILLPTCKTGRLFSLEVPPQIKTCEQAQEWLHSGSRADQIIGKTRVIGRS